MMENRVLVLQLNRCNNIFLTYGYMHCTHTTYAHDHHLYCNALTLNRIIIAMNTPCQAFTSKYTQMYEADSSGSRDSGCMVQLSSRKYDGPKVTSSQLLTG